MIRSIYLLAYTLIVFLFGGSISLSNAQAIPFYRVTPFDEEEYFTKTVFSFNPAFIKKMKVQTISLRNNASKGMSYYYGFSREGLVEQITTIRSNRGKTDTAFYKRYYYDEKGRVEKSATIDYNDGIVKITSYWYREDNLMDITRTFVLNSGMPGRPQDNSWYGTPAPGIDKVVLQGTPPDNNMLEKMISEHNFSSCRYRHYAHEEYDAEERTELDDSRMLYGKTDTCVRRFTYYYLQGRPVSRYYNENCSETKLPSEVYQYKQGLLTEKANMPDALQPRKEQYTYDKNKNLVLMEDIWSGKKVSELIMTYDKKGFLTAIQRKSQTAEAVSYFEDRILTPGYTFYQ
jgi:hypothetical protein